MTGPTTSASQWEPWADKIAELTGCAQDDYDGQVKAIEALKTRAEKAEARLAELVSEVIAWNAAGWVGVPLSLIVGKYKSPEPAKPEPRCRVCGRPNTVETHSPPLTHDFEPEGDHG